MLGRLEGESEQISPIALHGLSTLLSHRSLDPTKSSSVLVSFPTLGVVRIAANLRQKL